MSNKKDSESGNWNWEENDKEFYQKFLRLPESKNKKYYQAMKEHRFKFGTTKNKIDLRPRTFLSVMKVEIILLIFGVGFAITLPFYSQHLHAKLREPDEINIENIKNRVSSSPGEIHEKKSRMKFEQKLSKDYIKDDDHARIKEEIEKTMRDLYGENSTNSYYSYNNRKL